MIAILKPVVPNDDEWIMTFRRIVYISDAVSRLSEANLRGVIDIAGGGNAPGIGGLLVHSGGHFIQAFEGPTLPVLRLYDRIASDPRHCNVQELLNQPVSHRFFPEWGIRFTDADRARPMDRMRIDKLVLRLRLRSGTVDVTEVLGFLQEFGQQPLAAAA